LIPKTVDEIIAKSGYRSRWGVKKVMSSAFSNMTEFEEIEF
jgi:hypothetical protein